MVLGQFLSRGASKTFIAIPLWTGIGYSIMAIGLCITMFYSTIIAWVVHYFFASFRSSLVWHKCSNKWNTDSCIERDTLLGEWTYSIKNNISILYCDSKNETIVNCTKGVLATNEYLK